jgi:hypothetical protein
MLVAVTDQAVERYRQRIAGALDARPEIIRRVVAGVGGGRVEHRDRGTLHVRDIRDRSLIFVCRPTDATTGADGLPRELLVVTLWEHEGGVAAPRVPRRFTDALRDRDEQRRDR